MMKTYTEDDIRRRLKMALATQTQASISKDSGAKAQNLSLMVNGAPINGKLLSWLGFERVTRYVRKESK